MPIVPLYRLRWPAIGILSEFIKFVQFVPHHHAVTIPLHSVCAGTWYQLAHGHCLATLVPVVSHQLFVISLFAQVYGLAKLQLHTNQYVSVHAFNHTVQAIVVFCCVTGHVNHLFLHHWYKYQARASTAVLLSIVVLVKVWSVYKVVAHKLHACSVYQVLDQLHTIICHAQVKSNILFPLSHVATHAFVTVASLFQLLSA